MKKYIAKSFLVVIAFLMSTVAFAQGDFGGDPADTNPTDEPAAPISDYIWVLAIIGLVYVFYKMKNRFQVAK
ncbi:hypothetical protein [Flavobacterium macacae]|uniref:Signal peptidase n=1 Tax=Flavobacterium macacae TaxID=2488993 RepID=A0A3P3W639_9FLAO|nr:hypothetical protein [Flavobacterium macacae]RRJ90480.1 hypothetical protein EG849_10620 [Flavobacterium macacae]